MDKAIKIKWLKALRSGEYKQYKGRLVNQRADGSFQYCVLGVLCKVAGFEQTDFLNGPAFIYKDLRFRSLLPMGFCLEQEIDNQGLALSHLNDTGSTFAELADIIQKRY